MTCQAAARLPVAGVASEIRYLFATGGCDQTDTGCIGEAAWRTVVSYGLKGRDGAVRWTKARISYNENGAVPGSDQGIFLQAGRRYLVSDGVREKGERYRLLAYACPLP
ncbi:hypothetical protein QO010_001071 [Caulobacter ginsengisoli]|uniref:Uncharacterized protein n=1 Tax=Caulobacter ginsengisoli TaxID=400775 RepID=A0ABU0IMT4_9CAUL|nr:hypothetical protein [Caulobacter ginsengisoli]MDQ0463323.1 hypothetical protein [Caulobacter ginsengisoli]